MWMTSPIAKYTVSFIYTQKTAFVIGDNPDNVISKLNCLFEEICSWCGLSILENLK